MTKTFTIIYRLSIDILKKKFLPFYLFTITTEPLTSPFVPSLSLPTIELYNYCTNSFVPKVVNIHLKFLNSSICFYLYFLFL